MKDSSLIPGPQKYSLISTDFSVLADRNVTVEAKERAQWVRALDAQTDELSSNLHIYGESLVWLCVPVTCNCGGTERQDCWGSLATSLVPASSKDPDSREEGRKWWNWTSHVFLWPLCAHAYTYMHTCTSPTQRHIVAFVEVADRTWVLFSKTMKDTEPLDYLPTQGRATGLWYSMCVTHTTMASLKGLLIR